MIKKKTNDSIGEIKNRIFALPHWVSILLRVRQYVFVKPFGLRTGSHEIPTLYGNDREIVIGENDKHLYYRTNYNRISQLMSIRRGQIAACYTCTQKASSSHLITPEMLAMFYQQG
jgi:hypothetical protein